MNTKHLDSGQFNVPDWPFYWLTRTSDRYVQHLEKALKGIGLDVPRWRVLMQLRRGSVVSVGAIAEHALVKLPTMTKIIQRMQAEDLVVCRAGLADARVTEVSITAAGLKARERAWTEAERIGLAAMAGVSAPRLAALREVLNQVFENLGPLQSGKTAKVSATRR